MGDKVRMKQTEKRNREEEPKYLEDLIEVLSTVEASKRQVDKNWGWMDQDKSGNTSKIY